MKAQSPFAAKVLGLNTYLSYQTYGEKGQDEASYYAHTCFRLVDFSDPAYDLIPQVQDGMRGYAQAVGKLGLSFEELKAAVGKWLGQMKSPGRTHKTALIGLINGFQRSNEDAFVYYVDQYVNLYGSENPSLTQQFLAQAKTLRPRTIGAVAPDIVLPNPEGDTLSLSSLRGKVVLVDFWASWCGPCRRENPNVRRMYAAYKDKGFEILGVSLDNNKDRWVQAIAQDQLPWYHVSDLKKWKSVASRAYGVGSIPFTVLLDAEGKIIAKGLRGAKLEATLFHFFRSLT
ncbi:MAG: TlpA disulfide reductase family protein [Bacteroidota bacterium]